MPFKKQGFIPPAMRRHVRGQAFCHYDGKDYWLGPWGSEKANQAYLRLIVHLEERFHAKAAGVSEPTRADALLVDEAILRYLWFLEHDEDGDLLPDGTLASHFNKARWHLKPLSAVFGLTVADDFSASDLKALRKLMRSGQWSDKASEWSQGYCNEALTNIRRFFAWLESENLTKAGKAEHLKTVKPLRVPKKENAKMVDNSMLDIVCEYTCPTVATMIRLQRLTAARPSEICVMRPCDIDRKGEIWVYRPESHKTAHLNKERAIPLGRDCQRLLTPFLDRADDEYLFKPAEAMEWWKKQESKETVTRKRKTKVYPCELREAAWPRPTGS